MKCLLCEGWIIDRKDLYCNEHLEVLARNKQEFKDIPMPYGEAVQELTYLRAQYEQFIIDREQERIVKLLMDRAFWLVHLDRLTEAEELKLQVAVIKGEKR